MEIDTMKGKKLLVLGGAGTLGKEIIRRAVENEWGCHITIFSRDTIKHQLIRQKYPQVHSVIGDVRDATTLYNAMSGKDIVIHAAAVKHIPVSEINSIDTWEINVEGSMNVLNAAMLHGTPQVIGISTDKACLEWHSPVLLENGKTIEIGELVNRKVECNVQSYVVEPYNHKIKPMKVTDWHKNKLSGRKMFSVSYKNAPSRSGVSAHVLVTEDHKILCNKDGYMDWIEASKIVESGAKLITAEWRFNWMQEALLCGTVMGDSSISIADGEKTRPRLRMAHAKDQAEWLELKSRALTLKKPINIQNGKGGRQDVVSVNSSTTASLFEYLSSFYPDGKKIIPKDLFTRCFNHGMTRPILMSSWYMDDGCTTDGLARIATHGFTADEVDWVSSILTEEGFVCYPYIVTVDGHEYCELRFTKDGSNKLYSLISEYIPPSMRYKIPDLFNEIEYREILWNLGETVYYHADPIVVEVGKNKTGDVYCIDVEDSHNFIVNNIVVHNCHPANAYGATKYLMEKAFAEYSRLGLPTRFGLVRYGNVLESTGSVIEAWKHSLERGEAIKITDPAMTRFFISPRQAVKIITDSIAANTPSGHILIPKMKALSIGKLAEYTLGDYEEVVRIPLRPGEKIHETLLTTEECEYAIETSEYFVLRPTTSGMVEAPISEPYASNTAPELTRDELMDLLRNE